MEGKRGKKKIGGGERRGKERKGGKGKAERVRAWKFFANISPCLEVGKNAGMELYPFPSPISLPYPSFFLFPSPPFLSPFFRLCPLTCRGPLPYMSGGWGEGVRRELYEIGCQLVLITNVAYGLSIDADNGDLEWPWTA